MTDRKKPGVAFWATVVVVVASVYALSIGPVCWLSSRLNVGMQVVPIAYRPITRLIGRSRPAGSAIQWYSSIGAPPGWGWYRETVHSDIWEWSYSWRYDPRATGDL